MHAVSSRSSGRDINAYHVGKETSSLDGGGRLSFYVVVYRKRAYRRCAQTKLGVFIMMAKDKD